MQKLFSICALALLIFASTGAFRAVAAWGDASPPVETAAIRAIEKAPCCKTYKVHKDAVHAACNLPLALLDQAQTLVVLKASEAFVLSRFARHDGTAAAPEKRPPRRF